MKNSDYTLVIDEQDIPGEKNFYSGNGSSETTYRAPKSGALAKRVLDVAVGITGLVSLFFIYPFIAFGIKISSHGPVLFKQERSGIYGTKFTCYKFRTMHVHRSLKDNGLPDIANHKDVRIFRFGSFLRNTYLDEFPQFYNVIKGDMSVVGPRPFPVGEQQYWNRRITNFSERMMVKPGLTGLAQVEGYSGGTFEMGLIKKRLELDLRYIEKSDSHNDVKIIYLTFLQMIKSITKFGVNDNIRRSYKTSVTEHSQQCMSNY
ncbi:MAG: sugar transferase [Balneolales bacterium]